MARAAALLLLLACVGPALAARHLLADAAKPVLRVGFAAEPRLPMSSIENGEPRGMEGKLLEAIARETGYNVQIVPLNSFEDRIPALIDGKVDAVVYSFTVTAERSKLVQFVYPSYYSAGAAVFAPGGVIEGVNGWGDLEGQTLAVAQGSYVIDAAPQTPALRNVTLVPTPTIKEAAELVNRREVLGYIDDSLLVSPAPNLTIVPELQPILRAPISIAVKMGADELAKNLSNALLALAQNGMDAEILTLENETFIAQGAQPNPDLVALVGNPSPGNSTLYPATTMECWPVPSDSLWLPADAYQPLRTWKVVGQHNYTCDPIRGQYVFLGWLVNGTDTMSDKFAGYSFTNRGPSGTHRIRFVAMDEKNATALGVVEVIREAGSVGMPSPTDPETNSMWYRRSTVYQEGVFTTPKILYMTQTETEGGLLPVGTGPCKAGDPDIYVPTKSTVTFFSCRDA